MDPFTIRLLIGCLLVWFVPQLVGAIRVTFAKDASLSIILWCVFLVLVTLWISLAGVVPALNFHPR